ncbi:MAG TPA: glycosyltransferase, partial [Edaphobacter sp.]
MSTATTSTTVVRPVDPALRSALRLALIFSALKLLLHLSTNLWEAHIGYGYFRDELYYLACGRHLAWGYVDHGPIVGVQARLAETLFGHSLAGIRMLSALAGAARVFLTGLLAWSIGGSRSAQSLAMTAILLAPQYLGLDSFLSMNSFESLFWMTCLLAL